MSVDVESRTDESAEEYLHYRSLSPAAVASLVLGLLSVLALLGWVWILLPVCGVLLGWYALRQIRQRPDELAGRAAAQAGLILSAVLLVLGPARLTTERIMEVPEGYDRISYEELQPDPHVWGEQIPQTAKDLDGKKVFIKGYVYPGGTAKSGIRTFLLVRDQGDCCFGGDPKITDRILVTLKDPLRLTFHPRLHKLAGVFRVAPAAAVDSKGGVFYQLEADYLQ